MMIMGVGREGAKRAFAPLEIRPKNQKCQVNLKPVAYFRLIDKIFAITVYFPV